MATKTIPAKTEVTCDACGLVTHQSFGKGRRRQEGRLTVKQHGLDMLGDPACDGTVNFDLCDECLNRAVKTVNALFNEIRSGHSLEVLAACKAHGATPAASRLTRMWSLRRNWVYGLRHNLWTPHPTVVK
jgi:hypothetical protein